MGSRSTSLVPAPTDRPEQVRCARECRAQCPTRWRVDQLQVGFDRHHRLEDPGLGLYPPQVANQIGHLANAPGPVQVVRQVAPQVTRIGGQPPPTASAPGRRRRARS